MWSLSLLNLYLLYRFWRKTFIADIKSRYDLKEEIEKAAEGRGKYITDDALLTDLLSRIKRTKKGGAVITAFRWEERGDYLYLPMRIVATHIKYEGKMYELPKEYVGKYYVKGIYIPKKATTVPQYIRIDNANHVNCSWEMCCTGTLHKRKIAEVLDRIPEMFTVLSVNSALNGRIANELIRLIKEIERKKSGS